MAETDITIFEQDGNVYCAISHHMPVQELAKNTAEAIRHMPNVPRSQMKVVTPEEFRKMPWAKPSR